MFHCSPDHPHLHSFPTRRSSDLVALLQLTGRENPDHIAEGSGINRSSEELHRAAVARARERMRRERAEAQQQTGRSEEHTSELQSRGHLVCRLLLEKKKTQTRQL